MTCNVEIESKRKHIEQKLENPDLTKTQKQKFHYELVQNSLEYDNIVNKCKSWRKNR